MNCRHARAALYRAADGMLGLDERLELDAHVADCPRCAPLAQALAELDGAFARLAEPRVDQLDLDAAVRAVRERIDREPAPARPVRAPRRGVWLAAAAVIAAVAAGTWIVLRRGRDDAPPVVEREGRSPRFSAPAPGADGEPVSSASNPLAEDRSTADPDPDAEIRAPASGLDQAAPGAGDARGVTGERAHGTVADGAAHAPGADVASLAPQGSALGTETAAVPRPAPTPEELARVEDARERLATALGLVLAATPPDRDALQAAFARATADLVREQWPVVRMAEGLASAADPVVARPALRFLGISGDRGSVAALRRALEREELARDAALALADFGEGALDVLAELALDPRHEPIVRPRLESRRDESGPRLLEALLRRGLRLEPALPSIHDEDRRLWRSRFLLALSRSGPGAVAALLRLASDGMITESDALSLARTAPNAPEELEALLRTNARGIDARLAIAAAGQLRPPGGVAWLDAKARDARDLRDDALAAIAAYDDAAAAGALLRWHASGRVSQERARGLLAGLGERNPAALADLAHGLAARRDRAQVHELFEVLVERPAPPSVPALVELSATDLLVRGDRRSALQLVAELGTEDHAASLAALFGRLDAGERELRAACVLALFRLGGRPALAALFARAPERALDRLLAVCEDADASARPTTTLFRVLQELDSLGSRTTP